MTEREQRIAAIERLVTCYPRFSITKATLQAYADHLQDIPPDDLVLLLDQLAKTATFFPSIAEILHAHNPHVANTGGKKTGYRFVRGSHGSTYVRDPEGTDEMPSWMHAS